MAGRPKPPFAGGSDVDSPSPEDQLKADMAKRYEALNQLWKKAENQLKEFLVPREVDYIYACFVDVDDPDAVQYNVHTIHALGWAKTNSGWRLCFGEKTDQDNDYYWTPITDASVERRQECVEHFPALRENVIQAAKEALPKLDDAISKLSAALK